MSEAEGIQWKNILFASPETQGLCYNKDCQSRELSYYPLPLLPLTPLTPYPLPLTPNFPSYFPHTSLLSPLPYPVLMKLAQELWHLNQIAGPSF